MTTDRRQSIELSELCSELLQQGNDVEIASMSGTLRAHVQQLKAIQTRHDVSVCIVKFRPSTMSDAGPAGILGKLMILDDG